MTPPSVFDYDMDTRERDAAQGAAGARRLRPPRYETERVLGHRPGRRRGADLDRLPAGPPRGRHAPILLYGYGSYGFPLPVTFSSNRLSLLDRGVVVALAHVRGGGELGKAWHDDGRMMKKMNTFTDFIAAAEYLLDRQVRRAATGSSSRAAARAAC